MTSARRPTYRPRRDRREVVVAVLAVLGVLAVTGILIYVLQPSDDTPPSPTKITTPSSGPGDTSATITVPGSTDTTPTSAPAPSASGG
jgi:hypothetical protein